ncbi:MAG: PqqD family protein [Candidatus Tantalella remota]|nr:PqqD family protein [Candidatus Tantalella remota]
MDKKLPVRNPDIVLRVEEKEALLFDPADGNLLCINSTGIFIWEKCDGSRDIEAIALLVSDEFEVSEEKSLEDCKNFLKEMEKTGFVGYAV